MTNVRNDLTIYDTFASQWWDAKSPFSCSLHAVNRLCLEEIITVVGSDLRATTVIDLGCGGGLLARPLSERGATVLASDLSKPSVRATHQCGIGTRLHALVADARHPPFSSGCADLVLCADIIEHIPSWRAVLAHAAGVLKPGGRIFVSTLTRTWLSSFIGVHVAEGLGFVPKGTHDPALLVRPAEVADEARKLGLKATAPVGLTPCLWRSALTRTLHVRRTRWVMVSYAMWLSKPPSPHRGDGEVTSSCATPAAGAGSTALFERAANGEWGARRLATCR